MTVDVYRIFFSISGIQDVYNLYELIHDLGKVTGIPMTSYGDFDLVDSNVGFFWDFQEMSMRFIDVLFFFIQRLVDENITRGVFVALITIGK